MSGGGSNFSNMGTTSFEDRLMTQQRNALDLMRQNLMGLFGQSQALTEANLEAAGFEVKTRSDGTIKDIKPPKDLSRVDPFLLQGLSELGFEAVLNSKGQVKRLKGGPEKLELDEVGRVRFRRRAARQGERRADVGFQQRLQDALAGNVGVSPGLERDLEREKMALEARLASDMGPGWRTSSAGIQALQQFEESANIAREQAREQALVSTAAMSNQLASRLSGQEQADIARQFGNVQNQLSGANFNLGARGQTLGALFGMPGLQQGVAQGQQALMGGQQGLLLNALNPMQFGASLQQGLGPAPYAITLDPWQQLRGTRLSRGMAQAGQPSTLGALGGLTGTLGGAFLGGPAFANMFR